MLTDFRCDKFSFRRAVNKAQRLPVDLILMDIALFELNGLKGAKFCRGGERTA